MKKFGLLRTKHQHALHKNLPARVIYSILARRCWYADVKLDKKPKPVSANKLGAELKLDRSKTVTPALKFLLQLKLVMQRKTGWVALQPDNEQCFYPRNSSSQHWYQCIAFDTIKWSDALSLKQNCAYCFIGNRKTQGRKYSSRLIARLLTIDDGTVAKMQKVFAKRNPSKPQPKVDLTPVLQKYTVRIFTAHANRCAVELDDIEQALQLMASLMEKIKIDSNSIRTVLGTMTKEIETKNQDNCPHVVDSLCHYAKTCFAETCERCSTASNKAGAITREIRAALGFYDSWLKTQSNYPTTIYASEVGRLAKQHVDYWMKL